MRKQGNPARKDKIVVVTLRERFGMWEYVDSLDAALTYLSRQNVSWTVGAIQPTYIHEGREQMTKEFLKIEDATHLCFIDSDMVLPPGAIYTLYQHKLPMVGSLYFGRRKSPFALVYEATEDGGTMSMSQEVLDWFEEYEVPIVLEPAVMQFQNSLMECDSMGFGCVLIERKVVEAIKVPRYLGPNPATGEDVVFCRKAGEAGFKVYCDLNVQCGHIGNSVITQAHFRQYKAWEKNYQRKE